jgi:enolase
MARPNGPVLRGPGSQERGLAVDTERLLIQILAVAGRQRVARREAVGADAVGFALRAHEFPVHLIEDGLGEDDDDGWIALTQRLGGAVELVGDDNFCTNPAVIAGAIERGIANASLIKLNQIGTITETLQAMAVCRDGG